MNDKIIQIIPAPANMCYVLLLTAFVGQSPALFDV